MVLPLDGALQSAIVQLSYPQKGGMKHGKASISVLGLLGMFLMKSNPIAMNMYAKSPLPMSAHIAFGIVGSLISAACGYGILKGLNWSRFLYVGWGLIGFAFSMLTLPVTSIIVLGIAFFAVIVFFLFRPAANEWFKGAAALEG